MDGTYHEAPCLECAKLRAELEQKTGEATYWQNMAEGNLGELEKANRNYAAIVLANQRTNTKLAAAMEKIDGLILAFNSRHEEIERLRTLVETDRRTIDRLSSLAYPDGLSGDAGISCRKYMELQAELAAARERIEQLKNQIGSFQIISDKKDADLAAAREENSVNEALLRRTQEELAKLRALWGR